MNSLHTKMFYTERFNALCFLLQIVIVREMFPAQKTRGRVVRSLMRLIPVSDPRNWD